MALFFDSEWFDARMRERGLNRPALAAILGIGSEELDAIWKDQREISLREVTVLAEMLGVTTAEIAAHGGVSTPVPNSAGDPSQVLLRLDLLDARLQRLERGVAELTAEIKLLAARTGGA